MKSILIIGAKGMLGQELVKVFRDDVNQRQGGANLQINANQRIANDSDGDDGYVVTAWDREEIDVTNEKETREKIMDLWPDIIVNATAYNAVDLCETNEEERKKAELLNAIVPGRLAEIANDLQSVIVHYSTDYVFDGGQPKFRESGRRAPGCCGSGCEGCSYLNREGKFDGYREYDLPKPLSVYGKTKYEGERAVEKKCQNHYIIRLSKLFGKPAGAVGAKRSFFDVMLEKVYSDTNKTNTHTNDTNGGRSDTNPEKSRTTSGQGEKIRVVDGELSCFTYAPDLAMKTKELLEESPNGIYHVVNAGAVTWYEATKKLFEIAGITAEVEPVSPNAFPRPAKRPSKSVLVSTKTKPMRSWEEAVGEYLGK